MSFILIFRRTEIYARVRSYVTKVKLYINFYPINYTFLCTFFIFFSTKKKRKKNNTSRRVSCLTEPTERADSFRHVNRLLLGVLRFIFLHNETGSAIEIRSTCLDSFVLISDRQYLSCTSRSLFIINCHSHSGLSRYGFRDRYLAFSDVCDVREAPCC